MSSITATPFRLAATLLISGLLASACSSSGSPQTEPLLDDPINTIAVSGDPLVLNVVAVEFNITVPAYVSDTLQVGVAWGEKNLTVGWIGDELWSVRDDFPINTEHRLMVTFYDNNGEVTLGSFEQNFRTGTNALEVYTVRADQFDTDRWDNDSDGVSNIDELTAGTDAFESPRILLFSETQDFRHSSIETAVRALEELAASNNFQTDRANDSAGFFTDANLVRYAAVVWVMTS